jgi:hypothetical protein
MRGLVVYESMFGNTRLIAAAIADGLGGRMDVRVVRAAEVQPEDLTGLDCLVVGAPTHAHGLPRTSTRQSAPGYLDKPENDLALEPGADSEPGVREWLDALPTLGLPGAAFDTRVHGSAMVTGRASRGISKVLAQHGMAVALPPESFLVDKHSRLTAGEIDRARAWGAQLSTAVVGRAPTPA